MTTLPLKNTGNWAKGHEGKNTTYQGAERINARALIFLILNTIKMINTDNYSYLKEKEDFLSDKCCYCMHYLTEGECQNNFCESKFF